MMNMPKYNICAKCATENPLNFAMCRQCGQALYPAGKEPTLKNCRDCEEAVSINAEACPHCGCFYQNLRKPGEGWKSTIAWGVIFGYFGIIVISFVLFMLFSVFFGGFFRVLTGR